jgi:eukaryotic-like serine/threonine-protein kinase
VKRYIAGDTRGAVAAWRPLLGSSDERRMLRFVPVEIFDAAGETDIAELIDRETAQLAWFHGIGSSVPHMAKRALARGDKPRARELAQQVIDAWSVADVSVPAVEEMRNVLQRAR